MAYNSSNQATTEKMTNPDGTPNQKWFVANIKDEVGAHRMYLQMARAYSNAGDEKTAEILVGISGDERFHAKQLLSFAEEYGYTIPSNLKQEVENL